MSITTNKFFYTADKTQGKVMVGADVTVVFSSHPYLTFSISTATMPMLKNEKVEFSTAHGVKMHNDGYLQTLNDLSITFKERETHVVKKAIEEIQLSGDNGELSISFYTGRSAEQTRLWGVLEGASIHIEDNPEADSEATTAPLAITAGVTGHFFPAGSDGISDVSLDLIKNVLETFK